MTANSRKLLNLKRVDKQAIIRLLESGELTEKRREQLNRVLKAADPNLKNKESGMTPQSRINIINQYAKLSELKKLIKEASKESDFLRKSDSIKLLESGDKSKLKKLGFTNGDINRFKKHLKLHSHFDSKAINATGERKDKGKIRANIVELGGILNFEGHLVLCIAYHGNKPMRGVVRNKLKHIFVDIDGPYDASKSVVPDLPDHQKLDEEKSTKESSSHYVPWSEISFFDVLCSEFFNRLCNIPKCDKPSIDVKKMKNDIITWKECLENSFNQEWELFYFADSSLENTNFDPSVRYLLHPATRLQKFMYDMVNYTMSTGIFPTVRYWLAEIIKCQKSSNSAYLWNLVGNAKRSFAVVANVNSANCYWGLQGYVSSMQLSTSKRMRSNHWSLYKSFPLRPRVDVYHKFNYFESSASLGDSIFKKDLEAFIQPIPGQGFYVPIPNAQKPKEVAKNLRAHLKKNRMASSVYYVDGLVYPEGIRIYFNQIPIDYDTVTKDRHAAVDNKEDKLVEEPFGWACKLLPRRLQFEDLRGALKSYQISDFFPMRDSNTVSEHADGSLLIDGSDIFYGILEAFMDNWYSNIIYRVEKWQKGSLKFLFEENILPLIPDWENGHVDRSEENGFEWLERLPEWEENINSLIHLNPDKKEDISLAYALAQLWPLDKDFEYNLPDPSELLPIKSSKDASEKLTSIWASNFKNLFSELDADFLLGGVSAYYRSKLIDLTKVWVDQVKGKLYKLTSMRDDKFIDPAVSSFVFHLKKTQNLSDELIEECISKSIERFSAYQSKIVRMTLEGMSRQLLADDRVIMPYFILPYEHLRSRFIELAKMISIETVNESAKRKMAEKEGNRRDILSNVKERPRSYKKFTGQIVDLSDPDAAYESAFLY